MKAKVIREPYRLANLKIGEVVEIIPGMEVDAEGIWNVPAGKLVLCRKKDGTYCYASMLDMEIVEYDSVDWAAFRREAAKDILNSIISTASKVYEFESLDKSFWCKQAIDWADELIRQLKEK